MLYCINDISILDIRIGDYCWNINRTDKCEATDFLKKNADLTKKRGILKKLNKEEELLSHIKMAHEIITFGYIEVEKHKFH